MKAGSGDAGAFATYILSLFFSLYVLFSFHNQLAVVLSSLLLALGMTVQSEASSKYRRYAEMFGLGKAAEKEEGFEWRRLLKWYAVYFAASLVALECILIITS